MALPSVPPYQPLSGFPNNKLYQYEVYPVQLSCSFTVDSTAASGISNLKGSGFANIFMHSSSPGAGNYGATNPNPANGLALVQLQSAYNKFLGMFSALVAPVTGSNLTAVTSGSAYTITALGTATVAQWVAKGLPVGVTAAVGQTFLASATGTIGGSATVKIAGLSGVASLQVAGDPEGTLRNANVYQNGGGQLILQFLSETVAMGAYTPAGTNSAPTFTGSALASHNHDLKVIGGQAASTTNDIANYAGPILGKQEATDATYPGSAAATNGGVLGASAGTPAGSVSAPVFTGTLASLTGTISQALAAPANGTVVKLVLYLSNSAVSVNGQ